MAAVLADGSVSHICPLSRTTSQPTRFPTTYRSSNFGGALRHRGAASFFGLRAAPIRLNPVQQTGICRLLWRGTVRSRVLGAATLFLAFQLLAAASAPAQGP